MFRPLAECPKGEKQKNEKQILGSKDLTMKQSMARTLIELTPTQRKKSYKKEIWRDQKRENVSLLIGFFW